MYINKKAGSCICVHSLYSLSLSLLHSSLVSPQYFQQRVLHITFNIISTMIVAVFTTHAAYATTYPTCMGGSSALNNQTKKIAQTC